MVGGKATGVISLQNLDREHAFSDADVRLLTTLAGSLSIALENARLFEETRQRNAELALVNDVQRGLAENLDMQSMYDLVGDRIQEIFDAQVVDIALLDPATGRIHFAYEIERGVRFHDRPDRGLSGSARSSSRRGSRSSSTRTSRDASTRWAIRESIAGEAALVRASSSHSSLVTGRPGSSRSRTSTASTPSATPTSAS